MGSIDNKAWQKARNHMVTSQIKARNISDERVLEALATVPRHQFVEKKFRSKAYEDRPIPIGHNQTISQPYIVAFMAEAAQVKPTDKVLDIGTGSGYTLAVLSKLGRIAYGIEILKPLGIEAQRRLRELGYTNTHIKIGNGNEGWKEHAPFDVILVSATAGKPPKALVDQLAPNGRIIMPVGSYSQTLIRFTKTPQGLVRENLLGVRFVPLQSEQKSKSL